MKLKSTLKKIKIPRKVIRRGKNLSVKFERVGWRVRKTWDCECGYRNTYERDMAYCVDNELNKRTEAQALNMSTTDAINWITATHVCIKCGKDED